MIPKSLSIIIIATALSLFLLSACADTETARPALVDQMNQKNVVDESANRSIDRSAKQNNEVSFSVIYTGNLDEMLFDSNNELRAIIETYELQLTAPFEVDETMKGIVLRTYYTLDNPLEIAKEISRCAEVMMVEAKNLPEAGIAL
jgi:hypothetical protein